MAIQSTAFQSDPVRTEIALFIDVGTYPSYRRVLHRRSMDRTPDAKQNLIGDVKASVEAIQKIAQIRHLAPVVQGLRSLPIQPIPGIKIQLEHPMPLVSQAVC